MKPFIRWTGGKQKHMSTLKEFIPSGCKNYFEPFLGAGSMFHYVAFNKMFKYYYLSDLNEDLITLWDQIRSKVFRDHSNIVLGNYAGLSESQQVEEYYLARESFNHDDLSDVDKSTLMLFLLKTSYNGGWRVCKAHGNMNQPRGDNKNPSIDWSGYEYLDNDNCFLSYHADHKSYQDVKTGFGDDPSFIFIDPPYYQGPESKFTQYTKEAFGVSEQIDLAAWCRKEHYKGNKFLMCNSDNGDGFLEEIYAGFNFHYYTVNRGNRKKDESPHKEFLIYNYEV